MVRLHPRPDAFHQCPYCHCALKVVGWHIPGMRTLADLVCHECGKEFYGDMLAGFGLLYPMLLEKGVGKVHDRYGVEYFAGWLRDSYPRRNDVSFTVTVESFRPLKRPLILNCLDALYGHVVLKLLNAQYYLDHADNYDLLLIVPKFLRWMVPDGVSEVWTVDLPLRQGTAWSDAFARRLAARIAQSEEAWLSVAFPLPHPEDFDISRFTRVLPFNLCEWEARLDRPVVTFVVREDRLWVREQQLNSLRFFGRRLSARVGGKHPDLVGLQVENFNALAARLRAEVPDCEIAVTGIGRRGTLAPWISDRRELWVSSDTERTWCELYARSHVVIGVHGSNMLLPSAHAGAVVGLVPPDRWGNILQDFLYRPSDMRIASLLYRTLPLSTTVADLSDVVVGLLDNFGLHKIVMGRDYVSHGSPLVPSIPERGRTLRRQSEHTLRKPPKCLTQTSPRVGSR
jgi:hypothetical protein